MISVRQPANRNNYGMGRRGERIAMIVIHVMEGGPRGTALRFSDPEAHASCHYGIGADGRLYQYVDASDTAWHTGNPAYNRISIGIELEGYSARAESFTPPLVQTLVDLVKSEAAIWGISLDRRHVIGHNEIPDPYHPGQFGGANHHTDPGEFFPWERFMVRITTQDPPAVT
jgi:N-acetyl-anhydromuramyl-L-alanine amidase AmpD